MKLREAKKDSISDFEPGVELWAVYLDGGSMGERNSDPKAVFDDQAEAKDHSKRMNKVLSPGEKKYYRMKYTVKKLKN